jgi:hypothetical protein
MFTKYKLELNVKGNITYVGEEEKHQQERRSATQEAKSK